ncbi:MAG: heme peroxidase [Brevundimonas sp.]|nr:MAG: heme peroxidase [Brevundimonas sp.]
MVKYIKSDLEFILAQIKIAEAHAAGQPLYGPGGLIPTYNLSWGLRTVDGTYNNLLNPQQGAADNPFPEPLGTQYRVIMVDPDGPGPAPLVPVSYTPGVDNDGPGTAGPGDVFDPYVRTISNLIVDQTLGNPSAILTALQRAGIVPAADQMTVTAQISAAYSPLAPLFKDVSDAERDYAAAAAAASASPGNATLQAAAAAALVVLESARATLDAVDDSLMTLLDANGIELEGANVKITNAAPDEGLSAPFNSWFTLFGQFFDHGLDLVAKGGNGTVFIPLMPDDPLYVPGGSTNFMVLTRATLDGPGVDGILGTADDTHRPVNTTTPFVDQNQTYTSHPSHQVFLRAYVLNGAGDPVVTGKLIEGGNGGMATWADLKAQAADMLGIQLLDSNVGNVPLLATDPYGAFLRGPNGFPQIVTASGLVEGDPAANGGLGVLVPSDAFFTGHAFLADIAHNAVPEGLADGDIEVGLENPGNDPGVYDNELLDAHYVAGDGRANENIGLTAVHHVFHSEHNRLMEHTKEVVLATGDADFIREWLLAGADLSDGVQDLEWNGERLFQAAKFGTEMQYQHLVFEEFARKIQPNINVFLVPDGYDITMDPSIVAEFAHVVYRFGHSMLNESIDRFDPEFNADHIGLIEGFLNPLQFENNGTNSTVDADIAAGAIIRGMTRQVGNEIDEFVTSALRNNLLGLPLDLATINLARGRDTGVPTLNEARRQFYEATHEDSLLKPYESWVDFAGHLKHEASIINFIASYGTHSLITSQSTIAGKRDAALTIITGVSVGGLTVPADAQDFLNATGAYAGGALGGLNNVDLWIGGLAEAIMPFGGMLGSTFNFVFEIQMEKLQSGDRFYYLQRLDGLHLFGEMENNSFAAMIMRNTDATHLPSDVFSTPGLILEIDQTRQFNDLDGDGGLENDDPVGDGLLTPLVSRNNPGTAGPDANYLRYTGGDHVVLGGTDANDILIAGIGDDTLFGDAGNDRLEGGFGNDIINAGDGDDIITDSGGDDNIKAGAGNDVVHAGPGLDLVMGNDGQDFIFLGTDMGSEVFAGTGNDFIYGNRNAERILGNEGDDWIETGTFDGAPGDNFDEVFAHDGIDGHDVFVGDGGFDEFIGEGGDDIMVGSPGRGKMAGMSGFDWATYKDNVRGVNADLSTPIVFDESPVLPENAALEEYASMEGLSGTRFNDVLGGTNDVAADRASFANGGTTGYRGSILDAEGIALINGMQAVLGAGVTSFDGGDIILGGDGSDVITGRMGDDIIDGDKWLDVQIGVFAPGDTNHTGTPLALHNSMTTLASAMFAGTINPGQLSIVRTIRTADGTGDVDVAVFSDIRANYTITSNPNGTVSVEHVTVSDGLESDGVDTLRNIERLRFSDMEIAINTPPTGAPVVSDLTPTEGLVLSLNTASLADADGLGALSYQWQSSANGTTWTNIAGATGATFTPEDLPLTAFGAQANLQLRAVVSFTDGGGTLESVASAATGPVGANWDGLPLVTNTFNGTAGNDIADGGNPILIGGVDILNGNAGDDDLDGAGGNDVITGGAGNDLVTGSGGTDTAVFTGPVDNYSFALAGGALVVSDTVGSDGVDTVLSTETLRFGARNLGLLQGSNAANTLNGTNAENLILGFDGADTIDGNQGNDVIDAGAGDDTINWDANANGATDGYDIVDGGAGTNDTFDVDGRNGAETYRIYTAAAWVAIVGNTLLNANTEIVVTRNGTNNASIIAELDNIEEIVIGSRNVAVPGGATGGGAGDGDTVLLFGNFTGTSLNYDTFTVLGTTGDDTVSVAELGSAHRIVFRSQGGNDVIVGALDAADVIELPFGSVIADYAVTTNGAGVTTASNGVHSITFTTVGAMPEFTVAPAPIAEDVNGGTDADLLWGSGDSDVLVGNEGDDMLNGYGGADTTVGGLGNDWHFVDDISDVVIETLGEGDQDRVFASGAYTLTAGASVEVLSTDWHLGTDAINLTGNEFANIIYGNEGSNVLDGRGGDDSLSGNGSSDFYFVDSMGDMIFERTGEGDNDRVFASASFALTSGAEVEILSTDWHIGTDMIDLYGNEFANIIYGNDGANILDGLGGDDTLSGNGGDDLYFVDSSGDRIFERAGQGDNDRVFANTSFALTAGAQVEIISTDWHQGMNAINLTGNAFSNLIYGNEGLNLLNGGGGNDTLYGWGGDDTLVQSSADGHDLLDGGSGMDTYQLQGTADAEVFRIYTRTEALLAGLTNFSADSEIIVTRSLAGSSGVVTNANIIAELNDIEEISINTLPVSSGGGVSSGGDTVQVIGDFTSTSLSYNTITIDGGSGDDMIDISALTSAHRVVFRSNGGEDTFVGPWRAQDVVDLPAHEVGAGGAGALFAQGDIWPGGSGYVADQPGLFGGDDFLWTGGHGAFPRHTFDDPILLSAQETQAVATIPTWTASLFEYDDSLDDVMNHDTDYFL